MVIIRFEVREQDADDAEDDAIACHFVQAIGFGRANRVLLWDRKVSQIFRAHHEEK